MKKPKLKVVINNDDYALSFGSTRAIVECFLKGITTSTSIRVNGPAYNLGCSYAKKYKKLGIGLHLNLTDGIAMNKTLAKQDGTYKRTFFKYLFDTTRDKLLLAEIEKEFELQYKFFEKQKISIDHVDTEKHVHMIPPIFKVLCKFCSRHKIKYIRIVNEPYYFVGNLKKDITPFINSDIVKFLLLNYLAKINVKTLKRFHLKSTDAFYGILHTNWMEEDTIRAAIASAIKKGFGVIEISGHPAKIAGVKEGKYTSDYIKWYSKLKNRELERKAFLDPKLKKYFKDSNIKRLRFKDI